MRYNMTYIDFLALYDCLKEKGLSDEEIYKKLDEEADDVIEYDTRRKEAEVYVYKEDEGDFDE